MTSLKLQPTPFLLFLLFFVFLGGLFVFVGFFLWGCGCCWVFLFVIGCCFMFVYWVSGLFCLFFMLFFNVFFFCWFVVVYVVVLFFGVFLTTLKKRGEKEINLKIMSNRHTDMDKALNMASCL